MNFILAFLEWLQKIHVKKSLQRHITHVYVHITEQSGHSRVENYHYLPINGVVNCYTSLFGLWLIKCKIAIIFDSQN